jgi:hypothetical protein
LQNPSYGEQAPQLSYGEQAPHLFCFAKPELRRTSRVDFVFA